MKTIFLTILVCILSVQISQAQWQPDVHLTNDSANSNTSWNNAWCIASTGNAVHVVWSDYRNGNSEIYYKRSSDDGVSWGADTRLTNDTSESQDPSISVSGSVVHVVWDDFRDGSGFSEIYYKRSTDGGVSWEADTRLTFDPASSYFPSITASGSVIHVVWADDRPLFSAGDIYYKRSNDGGASWESDVRQTYNFIMDAGPPCVTVSGSVVYMAWYEYRYENYDLYYKTSFDGGSNWGTETQLTNNPADSQHPSVSASDSGVHIVWMDNRDAYYEIYYKRSTDGGASWGTDTRLTNSNSSTTNPSVSSYGSNVHIVWADYRNGHSEIFYKRSTDGGLNWGTDTQLTNVIAGSEAPSVSVSGSTVHVVWRDSRDGNGEIYYKHDLTGNPIPVELVSFNANVNKDKVDLNWTTATETNNLGFNIERSNGIEFQGIGFVAGHGTTTEIQSYTFSDDNVNAGIYSYRLKQIDFDGSFEYSDVVEVEVTTPLEFSLSQNYPNPFNPSTNIQYAIGSNQYVQLKVYSVLGNEVATLVNEEKPAGSYEVSFNASLLSSGIYFYKLQAGKYIEIKKLVLLK